MTRESHVAQETTSQKNKTIMCHIIINKTQASSSTLKVNTDVHRVQKHLSFLLTCCCSYGICMILNRTVLR